MIVFLLDSFQNETDKAGIVLRQFASPGCMKCSELLHVETYNIRVVESYPAYSWKMQRSFACSLEMGVHEHV
jgi:hypothetical protein